MWYCVLITQCFTLLGCIQIIKLPDYQTVIEKGSINKTKKKKKKVKSLVSSLSSMTHRVMNLRKSLYLLPVYKLVFLTFLLTSVILRNREIHLYTKHTICHTYSIATQTTDINLFFLGIESPTYI